MVLCPVAIAVGCRKCQIFAVCPVKGIIGDQPTAATAEPPVRRKTARRKTGKRKSRLG